MSRKKARALRKAGTIIWFDFDTLCGGPRSQNDYLTHHIALTNDWAFYQAKNLRAVVRGSEAALLETLGDPKDEKFANSAAPNAGTINSGMVKVSRFVIGEARIPSNPAITVDKTQLAPARKSGENPRTMAPFSFSAAARVANPKRLNLNKAHSPTAMRTTTATRNSWFFGNAPRSPGRSILPSGNGRRIPVLGISPKRRRANS